MDIDVEFKSLTKYVTIKANYTTLSVHRGEYHAAVMHLCKSGQFDTVEVYDVKNFEKHHKDEIEEAFPKIRVLVDRFEN